MSIEKDNEIVVQEQNPKLEQRRKELIKEHKANLRALKREGCDVNCGSEHSIHKYKMGRYSYDNDEKNKKNKDVKNRTVVLYTKRLFFIFIASIIFNFGVVAFLNRGDTIPSGLSGFPMLAVLIAKNNGYPQIEKYFALMFLAVNVPLFLSYGLKEKKSFVFLTLAFMIFQIFVNMVFTMIPQVTHFINQYLNIVPGWRKQINVYDSSGLLLGEFENSINWPILVNGFLGSLCAGTAIAIAWKNAGSTGGTDIVAYYYSTKKQKSVASVILIINLTASSVFLIIFGFAAPHKNVLDLELMSDLINEKAFSSRDNNILLVYLNHGFNYNSFAKCVSPRTIFGLREVSTFLYILINNVVLNIIYPKYKKVTLEISCKDPKEFVKYFKDIKYWHAYSIFEGKSGYTGSDIYIISTTLLLLETKSILSDLKMIDPNAWIAIKPVDNVSGLFDTKYVEV